MSVDVPRTSTDFLRQVTAQAVRRSSGARGPWAAALAAVLVAYAPVILLAGGPGWADLPWLLAPLAAAMGWANAASRADRRGQLASWLFVAAALAGLVTQIVWAYEMHVLATRDVPYAAWLFLVPNLLLAAGAWLALGSRRSWSPGLTADALIVLLAGTVAVLRLVVEPAMAAPAASGERVLIVSLQTLGLPPLFLASVLLLRRRSALSPASAVTLFSATVAFAAGGMLSLVGLDPQPLTMGAPFNYLWLLGWLLMASSGFAARTVPATAQDMLRDRVAHDGVRRMIVPAAALFLALSVVDVALRPVTRPETVIALALLAAIFALRTAHAFSLAEREESRKRQLAYTRALVAVTHSLAEAKDLDATLHVIANSVRSVMGTRAAGIELVDEQKDTLETRAVVGLPERVLGMRFAVRDSFTGWVVQHGEPRATADPSTDPYIRPPTLEILGRSPLAAAPIRFRGETTGALYACIRSEPFDPEELYFLGAMAEQAAIAIERARLFHQVSVLSVTDPLTGLPNRRFLEREMEREFAAARRGRDITAVMFDLDNFKRYNDSFGHIAGDEVLRAFAAALRDETRAMNLAARYGGDEFVALLSDTRAGGAHAFIERLRLRFRERVLALGRGPVELSAGLATFHPGMRAPEDLLRAADQDLYRQKTRARV